MRSLRDFLLEPAPARSRSGQPVAHDPAAPPEEAAPGRRAAQAAAHAGPAVWGAAPSATAGPVAARPRAAALPVGVAVLCTPDHARALGSAVALLLARRARARAGLVVVWAQPGGGSAAPVLGVAPAARRLAAALEARGLEARATGKLAVVALPADAGQASAAAVRAIAAAGASPSVLALGRRDARFDALLGEQDRVLVATPRGADAALTRLAVAGLATVAGDVRACRAEPSSLDRAVAAAGICVPATLRRSLRQALRGLDP